MFETNPQIIDIDRTLRAPNESYQTEQSFLTNVPRVDLIFLEMIANPSDALFRIDQIAKFSPEVLNALLHKLAEDQTGSEILKNLKPEKEFALYLKANDGKKALIKIEEFLIDPQFTFERSVDMYSACSGNLQTLELLLAVNKLIYDKITTEKQRTSFIRTASKSIAKFIKNQTESNSIEKIESDLDKISPILTIMVHHRIGLSERAFALIEKNLLEGRITTEELSIYARTVIAQVYNKNLSLQHLKPETLTALYDLHAITFDQIKAVTTIELASNAFKTGDAALLLENLLLGVENDNSARALITNLLKRNQKVKNPAFETFSMLVLASHSLIGDRALTKWCDQNKKRALAKLPELETIVKDNLRYLHRNCTRFLARLIDGKKSDLQVIKLALLTLSSKEQDKSLYNECKTKLKVCRARHESTNHEVFYKALSENSSFEILAEALPKLIKTGQKASLAILENTLSSLIDYENSKTAKFYFDILAKNSPLIAHAWCYFAIENHTLFKRNQIVQMTYWTLPKDLFKENTSVTEQDFRALGLFAAACSLPNTSNVWKNCLTKMSDNFNRADLNSRKGKMIIEMCKAGVAANQSKALFETIADLLKDDLRLKNVFYSLVEQINKSS